jgi:hypothetical protein
VNIAREFLLGINHAKSHRNKNHLNNNNIVIFFISKLIDICQYEIFSNMGKGCLYLQSLGQQGSHILKDLYKPSTVAKAAYSPKDWISAIGSQTGLMNYKRNNIGCMVDGLMPSTTQSDLDTASRLR